MWWIHRHIGMGGEQLVRAVAGAEIERRLGAELEDASAEEFARLRDECEPLDGARELVAALRERGHAVVLASSSSSDDLEYFLERLGVRDLVQGWTTKEDVERSKPAPSIVRAALEKAGADGGVMVGDSRWDIEAAANAGLMTVCVTTGGWSRQELENHGALAVFDSLVELREGLDGTPLR
jgi:HAD superfamily hydrolase (TIGR01509 family)